MTRLLSNGLGDGSFGFGGTAEASFGSSVQSAFDVAVQAEARSSCPGSRATAPTGFAVARFDSAGELDPGFGSNGTVDVTFARPFSVWSTLAFQADGRIVVAGRSVGEAEGDIGFALFRLTSSGGLDPNVWRRRARSRSPLGLLRRRTHAGGRQNSRRRLDLVERRQRLRGRPLPAGREPGLDLRERRHRASGLRRPARSPARRRDARRNRIGRLGCDGDSGLRRRAVPRPDGGAVRLIRTPSESQASSWFIRRRA